MKNIARMLLLALTLAPSLAAASAGKVLFALGRVEIQRQGAVIPATRGTLVQAGDQLELGPTGRTQLRMNDGAMIALQPGTSFIIEEYQAPPPAAATPARVETAAPTAVSSGAGRALFSLLKGGFRTITGLIGKGDQDTYQLKTPVATIGIRGTTYSASYCPGNCGAAPSGLYVGVSSGEIVVTNSAGSRSFGNDQYGYVPDENTPPEETLEPPADVLDPPIADTDEDGESGDAGDAPGGDGAQTGDQQTGGDDGTPDSQDNDFAGTDGGDADSPPPDNDSNTPKGGDLGGSTPPESEPDPIVLPSRMAAYSTVRQGPDNQSLRNDSDDIAVDASGGLISFHKVLSPVAVERYAIGTAQNVNQGFDPGTGLRWGRWSGGEAQAGANKLDLSQQSLHWIIAPETLQQPALPISGSAVYQLVGNTDPTDNLGNIGFLGSAQFSANFTAGTVTNSLSLSINDQVWSASGTANFSRTAGFPAFAGPYSSVTADGQAGSGGFAGFFTGPPGSGIPSGAGLSYSLSNGSATVSGAAAFGNPTSAGSAP